MLLAVQYVVHSLLYFHLAFSKAHFYLQTADKESDFQILWIIRGKLTEMSDCQKLHSPDLGGGGREGGAPLLMISAVGSIRRGCGGGAPDVEAAELGVEVKSRSSRDMAASFFSPV